MNQYRNHNRDADDKCQWKNGGKPAHGNFAFLLNLVTEVELIPPGPYYFYSRLPNLYMENVAFLSNTCPSVSERNAGLLSFFLRKSQL